MREILRFAGNVIVAYQAQPLNKNSYSIVVASLLSNPVVIAGAALVVAAIILVAALLLFRSSGKKKKANAVASSDWQRQGQQVPPPGWNQQGNMQGANSWNQPGQQPNAWNAQQQPAGWDAAKACSTTTARRGGAHKIRLRNNKHQAGDKCLLNNNPQGGALKILLQQQPAAWDSQTPAQQQHLPLGCPKPCSTATAAGWNAPDQAPQQPAGWNAPSAASTGGQQPWDSPSSSPDAWAQPQQSASPWGQQGNQPAAPTAYGNGGGSGQSWSQPAQVADQWEVNLPNRHNKELGHQAPNKCHQIPLQVVMFPGNNQGLGKHNKGLVPVHLIILMVTGRCCAVQENHKELVWYALKKAKSLDVFTRSVKNH